MNQIENQRHADVPTGIYQDLEEQIMANIMRHCRDYNQPIASDVWLLRKLAEIGKLNQENIRIIAKSAKLSQTAMERMLNETAEQAIAEMEPAMQRVVEKGLVSSAVPPKKSRNVKQVLTTMQEQAKDTLNLCNTVMLYMARDAYKQFVQNVASRAQEIENKPEYLRILNGKMAAVLTGAESRQQAMHKCIQEFNEKGIPAFVDKRGREWTPEAYVNMVMRSTSNTVAAEVQMARSEDFGVYLLEVSSHSGARGREWTPEAYVNMVMRSTSNTVAAEVQMARSEDFGVYLLEVSSHSGARPKCARDQGKIFDRANKSDKYPHWNTSSYGQPDGLLGINCGHHIYPYMEGVSIRRYFPTEDMEKNDELYKKIQKQRAFERAVRKQKRECMLCNEIGDDEAFQAAAVQLKSKEAKLKAYLDGNADLHRRTDREQVVFERAVRKQKRECMLCNEIGDDEAFQAAAVQLKSKEAKLKAYLDGNADLHRRTDREQVVGFNRSVSAKATAANKSYTKAKNTDTIHIKDIIIHKSVGAKARNYKVIDKSSGIEYEFAPGTRIQNAEVFAGKGTKHPLHEGVAEGLTEQYGGTAGKWQHAKGFGVLMDMETGEEFRAEVHWFQEETVGKVGFKLKREIGDES